MSRKKAKLCIVHDLQCKKHDIILTKKDCDLIANALYQTYYFSDIKDIYFYFKDLSKL